MEKLQITREDIKEFKKSVNGQKKLIWMKTGMLIDFLATLGISFLNMFSYKLPNAIWFYAILFILLVIVVLGGEMIGVYYGSLEQFIYNKKYKKTLDLEE